MKWFVRGDIDGFFGLFIDNLLQGLLIITLCPLICGFDPAFVTGTILPAVAVSILVGNVFYTWQARRLAAATGRDDVTALPYGINTVSLIAFVFLVMGPVYRETNDPMLAWKTGLMACVLSGVIEVIGAFAGGLLRRATPRAALLSSLAGIAITFISMGFVFQIFASPIIAIVPAFLILASYGGKLRLPLGLPGGFVAVCVGVLIAWLGRWLGFGGFEPAADAVRPGFHPPIPHLGEVIEFLTQPTGWKYLAVIFPMGLFNVIGSLQCLESAEAAGDRFSTRSSLLMNGAGTLLAAAFGSAFPTTIYIGHPGWKAMGARAAYSTLNGIVIALLCVSGLFNAVMKVVPLEVTLGILVWIGVIITAQAFQEVPRSHALGVAVGFIPSLAAWALLLVETSLRVAGMSLLEAASKFGGNLYLDGVIALNQGFILNSMILATIMVFAIERKFKEGACWLIAAAVLSSLGLIHAYELTPLGVENKFGLMAAPKFAISYAIAAAVFFGLARLSKESAKVE